VEEFTDGAYWWRRVNRKNSNYGGLMQWRRVTVMKVRL